MALFVFIEKRLDALACPQQSSQRLTQIALVLLRQLFKLTVSLIIKLDLPSHHAARLPRRRENPTFRHPCGTL